MWILLIFLVVCAVAVSFNKSLLHSILIFMVYSVVMSVVWLLLESPDLAITEAAVGAGVTSVLFFVTLKRIEKIDKEKNDLDVSAEYEREERRKEIALEKTLRKQSQKHRRPAAQKASSGISAAETGNSDTSVKNEAVREVEHE